jgi:hypothetical protein
VSKARSAASPECRRKAEGRIVAAAPGSEASMVVGGGFAYMD